ncbi:MAG: hypothetical protein KJ787_10300 [Gammaproteobacteria bacterium]|nr:hypothetical protein [Gammaproteobacteria bacterium]MBU1646712.1 hypothetical protein [Gammaproteobacteria bacterium]MBU1971745.1 hypothetical protein [Gammaproteobacteria bacterium]
MAAVIVPADMAAVVPAIMPAVVALSVPVAAIAIMAFIVNVPIGPVKVAAQIGALAAIDMAVGGILASFLANVALLRFEATIFVAVDVAGLPTLLDALLLLLLPPAAVALVASGFGEGGRGRQAADDQHAQDKWFHLFLRRLDAQAWALAASSRQGVSKLFAPRGDV